MALLRLERLINVDMFDGRDMFEDSSHEGWNNLPGFNNLEETQRAISIILSRDLPPESVHKERMISLYTAYALNSLLLVRAVRNLEEYSSYEKDGDFKSWPQFIKQTFRKDEEAWSKKNRERAVRLFLKQEVFFPEQVNLLRAEVGDNSELETLGQSRLFVVLEQYNEANLLTFDSLRLVKDEIEEVQDTMASKKRRLDKHMSDNERFMQAVLNM